MLKILNNLKPFFEDCYRRISVREYAKIINTTPPTASTLLKNYSDLNLLKKQEERGFLFFSANRSRDFIDLSRIYWRLQLMPLINYLEDQLINPTIILFGSLSKAETKPESDLDLAIITSSSKKLDLTKFEKKLKRNIQIFSYKSFNDIKNKELKNNLLNGYILRGRINGF